MYGGEKRVTQASVRTGAIFTDEFGREWYGTVCNSGHSPGHPISLRPHQWRAPLVPPNKYMEVTNVHARRVKTNIAAWKQEREQAIRDWDARLQQTATEMFGSGAFDAIERRDRNLMYRMGPPPAPIEQIEAYEQAHPWVLGLDSRKPTSLNAIFPEAPKMEKRKFLTWDEEQREAQSQDEESEFPRKRADGGYDTSDGVTFSGKGALAKAREHEAALLSRV